MYSLIKKAFEENQDVQNAVKMAAYMRNQFVFYGLSTPKRRAIYTEFLKAEKKKRRIDFTFLDQCWGSKQREFHYLVMDYLRYMQPFLVYDDIAKISTYVKSNQWWDTIDSLDQIIGDIAFVDQKVNQLMLEWSLDSDFWVRRIAINHQLCRKEKTDTKLLEQIIKNNFGSQEFFINKAIGWSLRDYSKTNPTWVKSFINQHKEKMSALSLKEASKYL